MHRVSNLILFAFVFSLAATDWLAAPTIAQDEPPSQEAPDRVPAAGMLTGATVRSAFVDGLEVELDGTPGESFVLELHNPGSEPHVAHFEVDCVQRTGSMFARMGPIPRVVHTELVEVTVPARSTVQRRLEADVSPPVPSDGPNVVALDASFTSTSFRLRRPGDAAGARPLAELRWPTEARVAADAT